MPDFRRQFLKSTAALAAAGWVEAPHAGRAAAEKETARVGVMGASRRALPLIETYSRNQSVRSPTRAAAGSLSPRGD